MSRLIRVMLFLFGIWAVGMLGVALSAYLLGAAVEWAWNPADWTLLIRFMAASGVGVAGVAGAALCVRALAKMIKKGGV